MRLTTWEATLGRHKLGGHAGKSVIKKGASIQDLASGAARFIVTALAGSIFFVFSLSLLKRQTEVLQGARQFKNATEMSQTGPPPRPFDALPGAQVRL